MFTDLQKSGLYLKQSWYSVVLMLYLYDSREVEELHKVETVRVSQA